MKNYTVSLPNHNHKVSHIRHDMVYTSFDCKNYNLYLDGLAKAKLSNILIVGCARNIKSLLFKKNIDRLVSFGCNFAKYHIFIYENDSRNEFKQTIYGLKNESNITVVSENIKIPPLGDGRTYTRAYFLCICRNQYFNYVKEHQKEYQYILVVDFDIADWRADGIFNSLGYNDKHWDMIGANGLQILADKIVYYDTFALIEKNMIQYDTGSTKPPLNINSGLSEVFSCFGGIGLYKTDSFLAGKKYSAMKVNDMLHPDHCGLATRMRLNGKDKIFINPNMIVIR